MNKRVFIKNKKFAGRGILSLLCNMKSLIFITAIFIGLGVQSCQSEYSERMAKAIELKKKHTEIQNILSESKNPGLKAALNDIEKEIRIQAAISGNEELFLKELWRN